MRLNYNRKKRFGIGFLLLSCLLTGSFIWYIKTWEPESHKGFFRSIGHFFFQRFGITSFVFCWLFFIIGITRFKTCRHLKLKTQSKYVLLCFLYLNVLLGFIAPHPVFPFSGAFGIYFVRQAIRISNFWIIFVSLIIVCPTLMFLYFIKRKSVPPKKQKE